MVVTEFSNNKIRRWSLIITLYIICCLKEIESSFQAAAAFVQRPFGRSTIRWAGHLMSLEEQESDTSSFFHYLGKGEEAIVREGCVLLAPGHEYNHFLMNSAVFIMTIGQDDEDRTLIRGVILDYPTVFTMHEMTGMDSSNELSQNLLFRGGDAGNDSALMLHSCGDLTNNEMIGSSGVYEGGLQNAMDAVKEGKLSAECFKFFYNYTEFTVPELDQMLKSSDSDGDSWKSVQVSPSIILADHDKSETWKQLRNKCRIFEMNNNINE